MVSSLSAKDSLVSTCKENYRTLENLVVQRLRWASGANPSLNTVLTNFQESSAAKIQVLEVRGTFPVSLWNKTYHLTKDNAQ